MVMDKKELKVVCTHFNRLIDYLSVRDIPELTKDNVMSKWNIENVDMIMMFGGTISGAFPIVAKAYHKGVSKKILLSGGGGHTTAYLREELNARYENFVQDKESEAEIMQHYLKHFHHINDVIIENTSTNCGNNITNSLSILESLNLIPETVVVVHDSTMIRRMDATLKKYNSNIKTIRYAPYIQHLTIKNNNLAYKEKPMLGMWEIEHYITLILGEIQRLRDDENGYGPNGKGYMVYQSYVYLQKYYSTREAIISE